MPGSLSGTASYIVRPLEVYRSFNNPSGGLVLPISRQNFGMSHVQSGALTETFDEEKDPTKTTGRRSSGHVPDLVASGPKSSTLRESRDG